jgi:hypothetical protein
MISHMKKLPLSALVKLVKNAFDVRQVVDKHLQI